MPRSFELFVARRYLRAKRKQAVISIVTVISIGGVAAGVMALVVAMAVNNGLRNTLQRNLLGATPHVTILEKEPGSGIENWRDLRAKLARLPGVTSASAALYGVVFAAGPMQSKGAQLKGVDLDAELSGPSPLANLRAGSLDGLRAVNPKVPGIVLGWRLAQDTGLPPNAQFTLISPQGEMTPFGPAPSYRRFRVSGTFESGFYDIDANFAYASLAAVQQTFALDDVVSAIELKLDDIHAAAAVAREAEAVAGPSLAATTWMEQNQQLLNALQMEKIVTIITISLIVLVAALNILITLVMMVMERYRDIAILMSMGARSEQVRNIFVWEGVIIGAVGTVIGLAAGYAICFFADRGKWIRLDESVYALSYVPFEPRAIEGVIIAASAIAISFIATLYPARSAAKIAPAEVLRYE